MPRAVAGLSKAVWQLRAMPRSTRETQMLLQEDSDDLEDPRPLEPLRPGLVVGGGCVLCAVA